MSKHAIIVVDVLNDFVTGPLGCDNAKKIIKPLQELLEVARSKKIPVIYSNDSHLKGIDKELELWGDHAIRGTYGAEVIDEIKPQSIDYIVPKRRYSGFFQTDLDLLLKELNVDTIVIAGLHTHLCCRHTSADAYNLGYNIIVPKETTSSFTDEDYQGGLKYLKEVYGANIISLEEYLNNI